MVFWLFNFSSNGPQNDIFWPAEHYFLKNFSSLTSSCQWDSLVIYMFLCVWLSAMKTCELLSVRYQEQWWEPWPWHVQSAAWSQLFHNKSPLVSFPKWLCEDLLRGMTLEATRHYCKVRVLFLTWRKFFRCLLLPPYCKCFSKDHFAPSLDSEGNLGLLPSKFSFLNASSAIFP